MMTELEQKELEALRRLRNWVEHHVVLHEWTEGKPKYAVLENVEVSVWNHGQELLEATYK